MMSSLSKNLPHDLHADTSFPFLTCIATDAAPFILFVSHHIMYRLCATPLDTDFVHGILDLLLTFDFRVNVDLNLCQSFILFSGQHVITKEYWFI